MSAGSKVATRRRRGDKNTAARAILAGPRLGLCCQFAAAPIRFRTTTAAALRPLPRSAQLARLAELARANADALLASLFGEAP